MSDLQEHISSLTQKLIDAENKAIKIILTKVLGREPLESDGKDFALEYNPLINVKRILYKGEVVATINVNFKNDGNKHTVCVDISPQNGFKDYLRGKSIER